MNSILITGASSGIGEAYARHFAKSKNPCKLVLVARNTTKLKQLQAELSSENTRVEIISMDLSKENAAGALHEMLRNKNIQVKTLINSAGFATNGLFSNSNFEKQHAELGLNVTFLTEITYYLLKEMLPHKQGTVINIASCAGFNPIPYGAVYAATKAYVLSFTQSLSYEYAASGIKFLAVCPGPTDTNFFANFQSIDKNMRSAQSVVDSSLKALRKNKIVCSDGFFSKLQSLMSHLLSRKMAVRITGAYGKKNWR